jgi:hypothetical protein
MGRAVFDDPADPEEEFVVIKDGLADRIPVSEKLAGHISRWPDHKRFGQGVRPLAVQNGNTKDLHKIRIDAQEIVIPKDMIPDAERCALIGRPSGELDIG